MSVLTTYHVRPDKKLMPEVFNTHEGDDRPCLIHIPNDNVYLRLTAKQAGKLLADLSTKARHWR